MPRRNLARLLADQPWSQCSHDNECESRASNVRSLHAQERQRRWSARKRMTAELGAREPIYMHACVAPEPSLLVRLSAPRREAAGRCASYPLCVVTSA